MWRKTLSFALIHMTVAFTVGTVMTGNPWVGGALAVVEPLCNTLAYHLHEGWWRRRDPRMGALPH